MLLHYMVLRHSALTLIYGKPATHTAELLGLANQAMSMRQVHELHSRSAAPHATTSDRTQQAYLYMGG